MTDAAIAIDVLALGIVAGFGLHIGWECGASLLRGWRRFWFFVFRVTDTQNVAAPQSAPPPKPKR